MAKHVSDTSSMELAHYATILRRHWVYVASALAVGVLLATVAMVIVPSKSTATTLVNINLISSNAFSGSRPPSDLLDMETEQALARSTRVMSDVATELGNGWTKSSVRAATTAALLPEGTVLRIQFTGGSAREAADGATLVADKYLDYRSDEAQERVDSASERLDVRRESLRKQLSSATTELSKATAGSPGRLTAELARQEIAEELSSVTTQLNELRAVNTAGGAVLTEADARQTQSSPNRPLMLLSGVLGGLLSGLVIAFIVNVLDRRVRDPYDVAGAGGGVTVARLEGKEVAVPAQGVEAEQIRAVRERVMAATSLPRPVLVVIDVGPEDAMPTDVAVNLAVSLADSGLETELIMVDHPVDVLVNVLHDLAAPEIEERQHVRRFRSRAMPTLAVTVPEIKGTRLATIDVVVELVAAPGRPAAVTVVALAPSAGAAARLAAGRFADQVLFAVHELGTHIDELAAAAGDLLAVGANVYGTVLLAEGRHLTAHPSVGEGVSFLRASSSYSGSSASGAPSAFTGGAVSGARAGAPVRVSEPTSTSDASSRPVTESPVSESPVAADPESDVAAQDLAAQDLADPTSEPEPEATLEPVDEDEPVQAEPVDEAEPVQAEPVDEAEPVQDELAQEDVPAQPIEAAGAAASVTVETDDQPVADPVDTASMIEALDVIAAAAAVAQAARQAPETSKTPEPEKSESVPAPSSEERDPGHQTSAPATAKASARTSRTKRSGSGTIHSSKKHRPAGSVPPVAPAATESAADQGTAENAEATGTEATGAEATGAEATGTEATGTAPDAGQGAQETPAIPANENGWAFTR